MRRAPAHERRFDTIAAARRRARQRLIRRLMIVGAVAVVTAVAAWQIVVAITSPDSCGTGMVVQGTECVGVTDGSHVFDPSLATVEGKITAENRTVQSAGDFVSVALLTPLTTDPGSDVTLARIRAELESAYTAQQYLNGQGFRPRIPPAAGQRGQPGASVATGSPRTSVRGGLAAPRLGRRRRPQHDSDVANGQGACRRPGPAADDRYRRHSRRT